MDLPINREIIEVFDDYMLGKCPKKQVDRTHFAFEKISVHFIPSELYPRPVAFERERYHNACIKILFDEINFPVRYPFCLIFQGADSDDHNDHALFSDADLQ